eukprot:TRINITY_DN16148_c0_g1_i2.p2 TRINITY_DN16148_c0_g1~~TRINITY_DN16148_c0_g1_i2.p2  ORF type:complete len:136 (+),score=22.95 TRINITY_DN16148_c0_g1_i2:160-567(+)
MYFKNAAGCLVVCDVKQPMTLKNALWWKKCVEEYHGNQIPIILVQNKIDLLESESSQDWTKQNFTKKDFIQEVATANNFTAFFQSSAKDNIGLSDLFEYLADEIIKRFEAQTKVQRGSVLNQLPVVQAKKRQKCC